MMKFDTHGLIAMEFNSSTVRICRSALLKNKRAVTHCSSFEARESEPETPEKLKNHLKKNHIDPRRVILMLPRYIAISRLLRLPMCDPAQMEEMVRLRAHRESFSIGFENMIYDWRTVGFDKDGYALVSVFIVRKDRVNGYLSVMEKAGIIPEFVTLNTSGFLNMPFEPDKRAYVLNADKGIVDFNVLLSGQAIFSRTFLLPEQKGREYFARLSKELKVSFGLLRRLPGYFLENEEKLYLTGVLDGLDGEGLKDCLNRPYEIYRPYERLPENHSVSFVAVAGMVLSGVNGAIDLTPTEHKYRLKKDRLRIRLKRLSYFCVFIYLSASLAIVISINIKLKKIDGLRSEFRPEFQLEKEARQFELMKTINAGALKDINLIAPVDELYRITPEGVYLDSFEIGKNGEASLKGSAPCAATVLEFLARLRESVFFKNTRLDFINTRDKKDSSRVSFKMLCPSINDQ